jgi:hypothetical protein
VASPQVPDGLSVPPPRWGVSFRMAIAELRSALFLLSTQRRNRPSTRTIDRMIDAPNQMAARTANGPAGSYSITDLLNLYALRQRDAYDSHHPHLRMGLFLYRISADDPAQFQA